MGRSTLLVIKHFLFMHKVERQGYKSCASLMKLADRYGTERLENACTKALSYTPSEYPTKKALYIALPGEPLFTKEEVTFHDPTVNIR